MGTEPCIFAVITGRSGVFVTKHIVQCTIMILYLMQINPHTKPNDSIYSANILEWSRRIAFMNGVCFRNTTNSCFLVLCLLYKYLGGDTPMYCL